jgi:hypothetical protein
VKIERTTKAHGEKIAAGLQERIDLDGTYQLVPREEDPSRYFITPAGEKTGGFRATVGQDRERGRITLLINGNSAVVMLGATTAPL